MAYQYVKTDGTLGTTTDKANAPGIAPTSGFITQPSLSGVSNPVTAPLYTSAPSLPTPRAPQVIDQFNQSLTQQLTTTKTQAQIENDRRAQEYETKIAELERKQEEFQQLQDEGLADYKSTVVQETKEKREALTLEKSRVDENYNANQSLIGEMEQLLTQGTQAIQAAKDSPGMLLGGAREETARVTRDVTARAGVIQALLSARNGQMAVAQSQLNTTLNAVNTIYKDQVDYYTSIVDFYGGLKGEGAKAINDLSKDQKDYLDAKLISLNQDAENAQKTADMIRKAMIDPDTAYAFNKAGVSLADTPQQINEKLGAVTGWSEPYMLGGDYVQKNKLTGETRVAVNVASGRDPVSDKPLSILDIDRYNSTYPDAGVTAGDTQAEADAKVQASNSPEAQTRSLIVAAKDNGSTYEQVVKEINSDGIIKDKAAALAVAKEVYGIVDTPASPIEQEIARLQASGNLTSADIRSTLKKRYTPAEVNNSSVGSFLDKVGSFLFGK